MANPYKTFNFFGGLTNGEVKYYYENSNIEQIHTRTFENGRLTNGEVKFYRQNSNIEQIHTGTFNVVGLIYGLTKGGKKFYDENGNFCI